MVLNYVRSRLAGQTSYRLMQSAQDFMNILLVRSAYRKCA